MTQEDEKEALYALVTAPTHEALKAAVYRIKEIIRLAVECPEEQNELKRLQLRELALLNGTLRDDEKYVRCANCGSVAHKTFQCTERTNFVNQSLCEICGGVGHVAADCRSVRPRVRVRRAVGEVEKKVWCGFSHLSFDFFFNSRALVAHRRLMAARPTGLARQGQVLQGTGQRRRRRRPSRTRPSWIRSTCR